MSPTPTASLPPEPPEALLPYVPMRGPLKFTRRGWHMLAHAPLLRRKIGTAWTVALFFLLPLLCPFLDALAVVVSVLVVPFRLLDILDQFLRFPEQE